MSRIKKRVIFFIFFLTILLGVYFAASYFFGNTEENQEIEEYTPQEEISESQYRETIVNLYFLNKESKELMAEAIAIDARSLSTNPYKKLLELLLEGPKNETLEKVIPEGTTIYDASIEAGCVIINFSKEFQNFGEDQLLKSNIINSIYKTLTELTEVSSIRFLIEGEQTPQLSEEYKADI